MQISIRDIGANAQWLAKISAFLHDASVPDPASYDRSRQIFRLALRRIGYEFGEKHQRGFFTTWRMPYVPAVLTVTPVVLLTPEEEPTTGYDGDQLVDIEMPTPVDLELTTREGAISLRCVGPTTLTVADTGPPEPRLAISDVGALILPPALIAEIINTSVV
jgi:hypothetical protein